MAIRHSTVRRLDHQLSLLQEAGAAAVDLSTLARPMILQPAWLLNLISSRRRAHARPKPVLHEYDPAAPELKAIF